MLDGASCAGYVVCMPLKYRDQCEPEGHCKWLYISYREFKEAGRRDEALVMLKRHRKFKHEWRQKYPEQFKKFKDAHYPDWWFVYG